MRLLPDENLRESGSGIFKHLLYEYLGSRPTASLRLRGLRASGGAHLASCAWWTAERKQLRSENRGIMRADVHNRSASRYFVQLAAVHVPSLCQSLCVRVTGLRFAKLCCPSVRYALLND